VTVKRVPVVARILEANDRMAGEVRKRLAAAGVRAINLISSPGAGKTSLLEATIPKLASRMRVGVVVGDVATTRDAERIAALGVPAVQITTQAMGGACHLEAAAVRLALDRLDLSKLDLLVVENVGNLVCPAEFDVGEEAKVTLLSVTEGEDKPLKYPQTFRVSSLAVITKMDLVPHLRFDLETLRRNLRKVHPKLPVLELSAQTGQGMDAWLDWLSGLKGK
jgi:hydrogenase nickel incorporation protein HypB